MATEHTGAGLKREFPIVALVGGGILAFWFLSRSASSPSSPATSPSAVFPRVVGTQRGSSGHTSSRANDSGQLATQVIGDIIGQKTALAEARDQMQLGEDQLTEQQNVAYRESNVAVQEQQNQLGAEQAMQPQWWQQLLQPLIQFGGSLGLGSLFGMSGSQMFPFGIGGGGGGYGSSGYPWMSPYTWGGGYGGYYPQQFFPSPYESQPWAWA